MISIMNVESGVCVDINIVMTRWWKIGQEKQGVVCKSKNQYILSVSFRHNWPYPIIHPPFFIQILTD